MRRIYFLMLLLLILALSVFAAIRTGFLFPPNIAPDTEAADNIVEDMEPEPEPEPELRSIVIAVAGDITAHVPQIQQAYLGNGKYDFNPSFELIAPYLQSADLAVGGLETSQAGPDLSFWGKSGYTGFPLFNAPAELSEALLGAGFDIFTLANNHALDRGLEGLNNTLEHVQSLGIRTFGAYKSQEERDNLLILDFHGIKIAFIGYTYCTNGIPIPVGHEYSINLTQDFEDITPILKDIERARASGADLIAVFPHWGAMYVTEPQPQRLRQAASDMAAAGADLIMGGHPHFIQPLEWFFNETEGGSERATLTAYSLGNFISNQHYPYLSSPHVEYGLLLSITITKNMTTGQTWISGVDYHITWVHRGWRHRILPLHDVFVSSPDTYNLSQAKVEELKHWHQRNVDVVEAYGFSPQKERAMTISASLSNFAQ